LGCEGVFFGVFEIIWRKCNHNPNPYPKQVKRRIQKKKKKKTLAMLREPWSKMKTWRATMTIPPPWPLTTPSRKS
jgi:hypothetical protein